jgi:uncharacterized protein with HEPN domain
MKPDAETDVDNLELIVEPIAHIDRRLGILSYERFAEDPDEIDLTAYRLAVIGETSRNLTQELRDRHPEIAWPAIYGLRNVVVHDYRAVDPNRIWEPARNSLPVLLGMCRNELDRSAR